MTREETATGEELQQLLNYDVEEPQEYNVNVTESPLEGLQGSGTVTIGKFFVIFLRKVPGLPSNCTPFSKRFVRSDNWEK